MTTRLIQHSSNTPEWYTPPEIVEKVRRVLEGIELDPASCQAAQEVVKADRYFSKLHNTLASDCHWTGSVFLNPPYGLGDLCGRWIRKALEEFSSGRVTRMITLTWANTETKWCQALLRLSSLRCFPAKRIQFWGPSQLASRSPKGSLICLFDRERQMPGWLLDTRFRDEFGDMGWLR